MSFTWQDYLQLAKAMAGKGVAIPKEASLRSSVSRSYYAVFGHAKSYAIINLQYIPSENVDDHSSLGKCFKQNKQFKISRKLQRLRDWRNNADYEDEIANPETLALNAISEAEFIFSELVI